MSSEERTALYGVAEEGAYTTSSDKNRPIVVSTLYGVGSPTPWVGDYPTIPTDGPMAYAVMTQPKTPKDRSPKPIDRPYVEVVQCLYAVITDDILQNSVTQPSIKLREVIWEITPECNKKCTYCGSRSVMNKAKYDHNAAKRIARQCAEYQVDEVNLSGGEPGTIERAELIEIIDILQSGGCKVKVITNGLFLEKYGDDHEIMPKVSVVGLSINTKDDVDKIASVITKADKSKITVITNFGTHNVWESDALWNFAKQFGVWQCQLTMGDLALNENGIEYIKKKLKYEYMISTIPTTIIMADNLKDTCRCTAGMNSCGITFDGKVISCLSERSYKKEKDIEIHGTCQDSWTLQQIWENGFKSIRFKGEFKNCRSCLKYPK